MQGSTFIWPRKKFLLESYELPFHSEIKDHQLECNEIRKVVISTQGSSTEQSDFPAVPDSRTGF